MTIDYLSYSQCKSYASCPRSWYLGKLRLAEEKQTWYIPMGSAVHDMIEYHLGEPGQAMPSAESFFYHLIEKQLLIEPDTSTWLYSGPEDGPYVKERALQHVKDCFEKALSFLSELDVWEVEYELKGDLPGCEVPIKGFVDIIAEHPKKGLVIIDWKTGTTKPDNFQLETYAALLKVTGEYQDNSFQGRYAMLSPAYKSVTRYVDLSGIEPERVGKKYQEVYDQMKRKIYRADPNHFKCNYCFQQDNCLLNAGPTERSEYYDRSEQDGIPY